MTSRQRVPQRWERTYHRDEPVDLVKVEKFLRRAPQFKSLVKTEDGETALTDLQQKFLDNFVEELSENLDDDLDTS